MKISKIYIVFFILPAITLCAADPVLQQDQPQLAEELPGVSIEQNAILTPDNPSIVPTSSTLTSVNHPNPSPSSQPHSSSAIGLRFNELKGIGYEKGYTTLESFTLFRLSSSFIPWLDLRGHVFNDGKLAGNMGVGGRCLLSSINHLIGAFLYYDVRDAHRLMVHQLSPGLELLGKTMEYRLNGYFPLGKHQSSLYDRQFDAFRNHNIWLKTQQKQAMRGFDAEIGAHLFERPRYDVYLGAGPYYLNSSHASSWGGKVRLLGRYKDIFSFQASYSYDRLFGSIVQGEAAVRYMFGGKLKGKKFSRNEKIVLLRARFAPSRMEIPVITTVRRHEKAINPATQAPWQVWFVDNTSHSLGTYESPFPTLLAAQTASGPDDIIYVFPGDGTTTGMDAGIQLKDGQQLLGSGITQHLSTTKGPIQIPAYSARRPLITSLTDNVITLANRNQVSGLDVLISQDEGTGIGGPFGIQDVLIQNNNIIDGGASDVGIWISGGGNLNILNNHLRGSGDFTKSEGGIVVACLGNTAYVNIADNHVSGYSDAITCARFPEPVPLTDITIQRNRVSNFQDSGILYYVGENDSKTRILDNYVLNDTGEAIGGNPYNTAGGISVTFESIANRLPVDLRIARNTIISTTSPAGIVGIKVAINDALGSQLNADIVRNKVVVGPGSGSIGIEMRTETQNLLQTFLSNNQVISNAQDTHAFKFSTNGTGIINITDLKGNTGSNIVASGNVNLNEN